MRGANIYKRGTPILKYFLEKFLVYLAIQKGEKMKKLIIFIILVSVSLSADKWEYLIGNNQHIKSVNWRGFVFSKIYENKYSKYVTPMKEYENAQYPLINSLNLLAEDGWELVEVDRANDALTYYIFKRKIEAN